MLNSLFLIPYGVGRWGSVAASKPFPCLSLQLITIHYDSLLSLFPNFGEPLWGWSRNAPQVGV
jgi:hypothetical protein